MNVYVSTAMHKRHKGYKDNLKVSAFMLNRKINNLGISPSAEPIDMCLAMIWKYLLISVFHVF